MPILIGGTMTAAFNATEVFEMAIQIERNGSLFYRIAMDKATTAEARDLLEKLASMEDDHERTFIDMRRRLRPELLHDPDDETLRYLASFVDSEVFDLGKDPREKLGSLGDLDNILNAAIRAEKDTIAFYTGIRILIDEKLGRDDIDNIIREEMLHVAFLRNEIRKLRGK